MSTYQKQYDYPNPGDTTITVDIILNTGTVQENGNTISTSTITVSFNSEIDTQEGVRKEDLLSTEAQMEDNAKAYIDGVQDAALDAQLTGAGFTVLPQLAPPDPLTVYAGGSSGQLNVDVPAVTNATAYYGEASLTPDYAVIAESSALSTPGTLTFQTLQPATHYYVRFRARANGYGQSDYAVGDGITAP